MLTWLVYVVIFRFGCVLCHTNISTNCNVKTVFSYSSPRPIVVEMLEQKDEVDGLPEKFMSKNPEFAKSVLFYYVCLLL